MATEFYAVGRIVWGHPGKEQALKDDDGKPRTNAEGKPRTAWSFGVAVPHATWEKDCWPGMYQEAASAFPNPLNVRDFAWKMKRDVDIDLKGKPYGEREGYAGCTVLTISTEAFAPPLFQQDHAGIYRPIDANAIKCGDFVAVKVICKVQTPKKATHKPGLYLNPDAVLLIGYGTEIRNQVDPNAAFGAQKWALPAGASAQPIAPVGMAAELPPGPMTAPAAAPPMAAAAAPMTGPGAYAPTPAAPATAFPSSPMAAPAPNHHFVAAATGAAPGFATGGAPMPGTMPPGMPGTMPPGMPGFPQPGR